LKDFQTTKNDLKRKVNRMPLPLARMRQEDLIKDAESPAKLSKDEEEDFDLDMDEQISAFLPGKLTKEASKGRSNTLYSRVNDQETKLEDFKIMNILG